MQNRDEKQALNAVPDERLKAYLERRKKERELNRRYFDRMLNDMFEDTENETNT